MALDELASAMGPLTAAFHRLTAPLGRPAAPSRRWRAVRMAPAVFLAVLAMWSAAVVIVLAVALVLRRLG